MELTIVSNYYDLRVLRSILLSIAYANTSFLGGKTIPENLAFYMLIQIQYQHQKIWSQHNP